MITVVIPTLNERDRIVPLVRRLLAGQGVEVIVADGGSTDGTADLAAASGGRVVCSPPGRARQMNAGAAAASGDVLLFLHADTVLPEGFAGLVEEATGRGGAEGGCFRFALDERTAYFRLLAGVANLRSSRLGIVFGDQAIFVRAAAFRRLGGYPQQPVMEDWELVRRLRREGKFVILPAPAVTSARRWRKGGSFRNTFRNVFMTAAYLLGVSAARLQRWRGGREEDPPPPAA